MKRVSGAVCFASRTIFKSIIDSCFTDELASNAPSLRSCNQHSIDFTGSTPAIVSVSVSMHPTCIFN